jgi:RimJ/RimL family protein N-acetyltransferase
VGAGLSPAADEQATLTDGVVTLRGWRRDDASAVFAACQDPLIVRFIPIPQPYTEAVAAEYVQMAAAETVAGTAAHFAIADAIDDTVLGSISRHPLRGHHASFGYWLAPGARGRGVATRALRLIADCTLATTEVIRLELYTENENEASGRVAERAGFVREGIRLAWDLDRQGHPFDAVFYARIRE